VPISNPAMVTVPHGDLANREGTESTNGDRHATIYCGRRAIPLYILCR